MFWGKKKKCLNLVLVLRARNCIASEQVFHTDVLRWSLCSLKPCTRRGQTWCHWWPGGRSSVPGRAGVVRQYTDKRMWIFLYAQTLPDILAFVTNVCLKVVSDVSVPLLLFVFRFNPHFPLSSQCPEYFQTPTGKRDCYVLCSFPSFLFLEGKQCNFLKCTLNLFVGIVLYFLIKGKWNENDLCLTEKVVWFETAFLSLESVRCRCVWQGR